MRFPKTATGFQIKVFREVSRIPRGETRTYAQVAAAAGSPNAARAVGQALKRNLFPILIPCHRVVNADGSAGGYFGVRHSRRKERLLAAEGATVKRRK